MSSRLLPSYGKVVAASTVLIGLVLYAIVSQTYTVVSANGETLSASNGSDPDVSIWVDAAPLSMVIRQLASLSGRTAEIVESAKVEAVAETGKITGSEELAETEEIAETIDFTKVLVSGRFSGSLSNILSQFSADYPVTFDLDGETLYAMNAQARYSVSIAMLSTPLDETFKNELLASAVAGNSVEFREDVVRVTGHPAFVKRQRGYITKAQAATEAKLNAGSLTAESAPIDATSMADSGSAEVLVDIQDEGKPPAEQANLSQPIRWVTDIPGFHTF